MGWEATVEAIAAGTGASVSVAVLARRWFRAAVKDVVDDVVDKRAGELQRHLERQDRRLDSIERKLSPRR